MCEHKWVYQMSNYKCEKVGYTVFNYCNFNLQGN